MDDLVERLRQSWDTHMSIMSQTGRWMAERNEAADRIEALTLENQTWRQNSIDTWSAMQAMRNDINELVPMPSIESDLLQGPNASVFCAAVAEAVSDRVATLIKERDRYLRHLTAGAQTLNSYKSERDEAEAKLAQAVEVLEQIETASEYFAGLETPEAPYRYAHETTRRLARAFLATIQPEGETDDKA